MMHCFKLPMDPSHLASAGDGIESEPFRLYNLDVFEYEHDSPFGLYGSVPYVISHKPDATIGAFWCDSARSSALIVACDDDCI
jgi:alpha 1,3-glucosidase